MLSTVVSRVRRKVVGYAAGRRKTPEGRRHKARGVAYSIALAAVVLLAAAPANAKPTKVSWPVFISVKAAPHTKNVIRMSYEFFKGGWDNTVWDTAGITTRVTEPPTCYPIERFFHNHPLAGKVVVCPDGSSVEDERGQGEDFRILLNDKADWFSAEDSIGSFEVHAGSGNDEVYGETNAIPVKDVETGEVCGYFSEDDLYGDRGNDRLYGRFGPDHLSGGSGNDYLRGGAVVDPDNVWGNHYCAGFVVGLDDNLRGGSGNDVLWAADDDRDVLIDCGPGRRDKAIIDRQDPKPKRCETVRRH